MLLDGKKICECKRHSYLALVYYFQKVNIYRFRMFDSMFGNWIGNTH